MLARTPKIEGEDAFGQFAFEGALCYNMPFPEPGKDVEDMAMASEALERAVELVTGVPVEVLRKMPLDECRSALEQARGKPLTFRSRFPLVGRGNVLRDRTVSHDRAERDFL